MSNPRKKKGGAKYPNSGDNERNISLDERNKIKKIKIIPTPESYLRHMNLHRGDYSIVSGGRRKKGGSLTCCGGPNVRDIPTDKLGKLSKFNVLLLSKIPFKS